MTMVEIPAHGGGGIAAYLATPKETPAPALVLLQEVYGVNRFMRAAADFWAVEGFIALVPDIYRSIRPGIALDPETPGHREQAIDIRKRLDTDRAVEDALTAVAHARAMPQSTGWVGTCGFCLGGLLAYLCGTRGDADANVSYYGVGIERHLNEAVQLTRPLMLHIGEDDPYTPADLRATLTEALGANPLVTIHTYPGAGHAFAREGASSEVPEARARANARTRSFFGELLADREPSHAPALTPRMPHRG